MKKSILELGKSLSTSDQKNISGGFLLVARRCATDSDCCHLPHTSSYGYVCSNNTCVTGIFFYPHPCGQ